MHYGLVASVLTSDASIPNIHALAIDEKGLGSGLALGLGLEEGSNGELGLDKEKEKELKGWDEKTEKSIKAYKTLFPHFLLALQRPNTNFLCCSRMFTRIRFVGICKWVTECLCETGTCWVGGARIRMVKAIPSRSGRGYRFILHRCLFLVTRVTLVTTNTNPTYTYAHSNNNP